MSRCWRCWRRCSPSPMRRCRCAGCSRASSSAPWRDFGQVETYAYSALWLALGVALLVAGLLLKSQVLRIASAALIVIAVAKVFLFDMSELEGVLRALLHRPRHRADRHRPVLPAHADTTAAAPPEPAQRRLWIGRCRFAASVLRTAVSGCYAASFTATTSLPCAEVRPRARPASSHGPDRGPGRPPFRCLPMRRANSDLNAAAWNASTTASFSASAHRPEC